MIPEVNIISGKESVASFSGTGGLGAYSEPLSRGFRRCSPLRKIDLNVAEIITVQHYKCTKN